MASLLFYMRRFHRFAKWKLYVHVLSAIVVSGLAGIGIYLVIPMLSVIGITEGGASFPIPWLETLFLQVPFELNLFSILMIYLLLMIAQALLERWQAIFNVRLQQSFIHDLRIDTYDRLIHAKWEFFITKRHSDFNHIMTNELARVSQGTGIFLNLIASFIFTFILIGFAFLMSPLLTFIVLASGLAVGWFLRKFVSGAKRLGDQTTALSQDYYAGLTEHFSGIKDIKSNRLEQHHYEWFKALCHRIADNIVSLTRLRTTSQFIYRITASVLIATFILLSIEIFKVPLDQLLVIIVIFTRLWPQFTRIQANLEQIASMFPAFRSLIQLQQESLQAREVSLKDTNEQGQENDSIWRFQDRIECRDVSFSYDPKQQNYALKQIDATIPVNQMTAIVGRSGAGKSTLVDVLIGMLQPGSGQIFIDGEPLTDANLLPFRQSISYITQEPFLFNDTIRNNLLLVAPNATEEELWQALSFASLAELVESTAAGLDTVIGDRGIRLSGGERQRLVLARAILRKPAILVLDEATSALDTENEAKIQAAIEELKGTMTIIVIAHRMSTIRNADQVIVLDQGRIVQQGGYQQLSQENTGTLSQLLVQH